MQELIDAAKAVIAEWNKYQVVGDRNLRAAVERAEKPAAGFEEWWSFQGFYPCSKKYAKELWIAGQQAERERIREIISDLHSDGDVWLHVDSIRERIDET